MYKNEKVYCAKLGSESQLGKDRNELDCDRILVAIDSASRVSLP